MSDVIVERKLKGSSGGSKNGASGTRVDKGAGLLALGAEAVPVAVAEAHNSALIKGVIFVGIYCKLIPY